jgi:hypothetical protein
MPWRNLATILFRENLAAEIKKGKDLTNRWHDGANLRKRRNLHPSSSNGTSLHFTLPGLRGPEIFNPGSNETNKGNSTIQVGIQSHYQYHIEAGEISYQGTTASFSSNKPMLEPRTNKTSTTSDIVNKDFSKLSFLSSYLFSFCNLTLCSRRVAGMAQIRFYASQVPVRKVHGQGNALAH